MKKNEETKIIVPQPPKDTKSAIVLFVPAPLDGLFDAEADNTAWFIETELLRLGSQRREGGDE